MTVFTITRQEANALQDFFPEDVLENIGKDNYHTLGALDDEEFVAGVLQFFVDFDETKGTFSRICYLYVPEEFQNESIATVLLWEYENILSESGVRDELKDMVDDSCVFLYGSTVDRLRNLDSLRSISTKDIYSISFIDDVEFVKIKKKVAGGAGLEPKRFYDDEISSFYKTKDECGLLLVQKKTFEDLIFSYIGADSKGSDDKQKGLVAYSLKRAADQFGDDRHLRIECKDYMTFSMYLRTLPEIFSSSFFNE